jgi:LAO/AO transport system kinase
VAVLAIDPSSQVNRGSILGDKTRMQHLSVMPEAFIRPSAAGDSLGGVARKTRDTMVLCEAAGFDVIIVETVGVGQSEVAVHSMVDFFLLLLLPGAGDELQGIKRGIVEMADLIAINKADGNRMMLAKQAKAAYSNALHLFPPKESGWIPQAVLCSALSKMGLEDIWSLVIDYQLVMKGNGFFEANRKAQAKQWMHDTIQQKLFQYFYENENIKIKIAEVEQQVMDGKLSAFHAAELLLDLK